MAVWTGRISLAEEVAVSGASEGTQKRARRQVAAEHGVERVGGGSNDPPVVSTPERQEVTPAASKRKQAEDVSAWAEGAKPKAKPAPKPKGPTPLQVCEEQRGRLRDELATARVGAGEATPEDKARLDALDTIRSQRDHYQSELNAALRRIKVLE